MGGPFLARASWIAPLLILLAAEADEWVEGFSRVLESIRPSGSSIALVAHNHADSAFLVPKRLA